jgi:nucleoid DNA-binding protein
MHSRTSRIHFFLNTIFKITKRASNPLCTVFDFKSGKFQYTTKKSRLLSRDTGTGKDIPVKSIPDSEFNPTKTFSASHLPNLNELYPISLVSGCCRSLERPSPILSFVGVASSPWDHLF